MFEYQLTPEERLSEYNLLRVEVSKLRKALLSKFVSFKFNMITDMVELSRMYKKRRRALYKQMVADCYRCYGTGTPLALQMDLDLHYPYCENCGKANRN